MKHKMYWMPDESERRDRRKTFEKICQKNTIALPILSQKTLTHTKKQ